MRFTVDGQLPVLTQAGSELSYWLDLKLNGASLGGGPFRLIVVPGPVYGPKSEILASSWAQTFSAGVPANLTIQARDLYGNAQTAADEAGQFMIDLAITKVNIYGNPMLVRGCTRNIETIAGECSFRVEVSDGEPEGLGLGQYLAKFATTDASDYMCVARRVVTRVAANPIELEPYAHITPSGPPPDPLRAPSGALLVQGTSTSHTELAPGNPG
eukprot:194161-Prorocentrum_minimum.AAC.1